MRNRVYNEASERSGFMALVNEKDDRQTVVSVRQADVKTWLTYETMSPLGRTLMDIAREIENSDETAVMSEEDIERELTARRGGYDKDGE
jgi:hypothetical protein